MNKKKYTLTAALPYANGALHLGHLAGAYLPADIYARFLRLGGKDIVLVCGSDEHGAAITIKAKQENTSPQEIIDRYHNLNKQTFERLGISFDIYHRTSSDLHKKTAQDFFKTLWDKGTEFETRETEQFYDVEYAQFLPDRYLVGTCPKCGHEEAHGDQCEKCGSALSPEELINPLSILSKKRPEMRLTTHWYFKLNQHTDWLREWVKTGKTPDGRQAHNPENWRTHVLGQCASWLDKDLLPRAITRDLDWGVSLPLDDEKAKGKVLYVWFDAPIGYISATKQWAADKGKNWEDYWKGEEVELIHFIGKDNIVFHCVIFPAMLQAHGDFVLPKNVPANQFLNLEGRKLSKSKGWVIEQHEYLNTFADFANKEDALRYALIKIMPDNGDSDFRWDDFVAAHDNELADNLGNFINRITVLTHKFFEGKVPQPAANPTFLDKYEALAQAKNQVIAMIEAYQFREAMTEIMRICSQFGNAFLQEQAPWKVQKTNPDAPILSEIIRFGLDVAELLSTLIYPFLPFSSNKIREMLNLENYDNLLKNASENSPNLLEGVGGFAKDAVLGTPFILYSKIGDMKSKTPSPAALLVEAEKQKLETLRKKFETMNPPLPNNPEPNPIVSVETQNPPANALMEQKPLIEFPDFEKIDLRIATILEAERVPKSDKLLKLLVDIGYEKRTILSGIAQHFSPESLINQQIMVVANLAPRKMMGHLSHGMVLMTESEDKKLVLVTPQTLALNGGTVR